MPIRVVVAEDSPTARALLVGILSADPDLLVVGESTDGADAVRLAMRLRPDVMTVDLHMPHMDGLEAIRRIMRDAPTRIVVVSSSIGAHDVAASMEALRAGALTALPKPAGVDDPDFTEQSRQLLATVKAMAEVKVVRRWASSRPAPPPSTPSQSEKTGLLAIAASTGGPAALHRVLSELRAASVPILIVQHIALGFVSGLVEWWSSASGLPIKIAEHGMRLAPRTVYVAPDGCHLAVADRNTCKLVDSPPIGGHRPSANVLFESAARVYGAETLALIMTGMGRDGVDGLRSVREAGGHVIAQDEASCIVFGMPGAAVQAGLANETLPLADIAPRLSTLMHGLRKAGAAS